MQTDTADIKRLARKRVRNWLILFVIGWLLGNFWLERLMEPVAVALLYPQAESRQTSVVRFLDLSALYRRSASDSTKGRLPAESFQAFLNLVRTLKPEYQPAAIGLDIPLFENVLPEQSGDVRLPADRRQLLDAVRAFSQETGIPVRIGTPQFQIDLPGLREKVPDLDRFLASTMVYKEGAVAPIRFGIGGKGKPLDVLGYAVATDFEQGRPGRSKPKHHALQAYHHIPAPDDWPSDVLPAEWIYVDYALLAHREALTVRVDKARDPQGEPIGALVFSPQDLQKLAPRDDRGTLWIVGVGQVPEREDIFVYDPHSRWLGEGEPVRRMYQHGAIAHTYLDAPLMRVPGGWALCIDVLSSLSGLMTVLLLDGCFDAFPKRPQTVRTGRYRKARTRLALLRWGVLWIGQGFLWLWGWVVLLPAKLGAWLLRLPRRLRWRKAVPAEPGAAHGSDGHPGNGLVHILIVPVMFAVPFMISWVLAGQFRWFWLGFAGSALYALMEPILDGTLENL